MPPRPLSRLCRGRASPRRLTRVSSKSCCVAAATGWLATTTSRASALLPLLPLPMLLRLSRWHRRHSLVVAQVM